MRSVAAVTVVGWATASLASACSAKEANGVAAQPVASKPCAPLADPAATIEYEAITTDGHYLVTLTDTATRATTRRVFYGTPARMVEGTITDVQNSCAHFVTFDVEGSSYSARLSFGSCSSVEPGLIGLIYPDGGFVDQGLTVLEAGGRQLDGGVGPAGVGVSALTFLCF